MNSFFDKLKEVSDVAGVPTPSLAPTPTKTVPIPSGKTASPAPNPATPTDLPDEAKSGDGLADAADSECVTPDGWEPAEAFDGLYDEEDN